MEFRHLYLICFMITVAFISYFDVKDRKGKDLPWPPRIVATGMVFAMLDLFGGFQPELSSVMAFGFMIAIIIAAKLKPTVINCKCLSQATSLPVLPGVKVNIPGEDPGTSPTDPALPEGAAPELPPAEFPELLP
jgi:hypothetical protein